MPRGASVPQWSDEDSDEVGVSALSWTGPPAVIAREEPPAWMLCFGGLLLGEKGRRKQLRLKTGFWDFRGLGAPMRMMCRYAGVMVEDVKYEAKKKVRGSGWVAPRWEREDKPTLKERNSLVQLPYVINCTTGEVVSQSNAVYLYLGRLLGLAGVTEKEQLANEQVLFHMHGMWMELRDLVYPFKNSKDEIEFKASLPDHFATCLPTHYGKLEDWLNQHATRFFAGAGLVAADFHVWEMLDQQEAMAVAYGFVSPLSAFPLLKGFYERFQKLARMRVYFDSEDAQLPINNRMAFFK